MSADCAPINYSKEDFVQRVDELTKGAGVPVIYDSVGKDTFIKDLECLQPLGTLVLFGQSSGPVPPFDVGTLARGSHFVTRPGLGTISARGPTTWRPAAICSKRSRPAG